MPNYAPKSGWKGDVGSVYCTIPIGRAVPVDTADGISIGSSVSAGLTTSVSNGDRPRYICSNGPQQKPVSFT